MSRRARHILTAVIALSALASIFFGLRSYGSYLLLRSAYEAGRPQLSSLRPWMTLDHVAASYRVPLNELLPRLGLPPAPTPPATRPSRTSPPGGACLASSPPARCGPRSGNRRPRRPPIVKAPAA